MADSGVNEERRSPPAPQQTTVSIPLQSLPLRPSTLTALLRSGFSTTGDVVDSCRTEMVAGDAGGESNGGGGDRYGCFAKELGCSLAQAADFANEIDEALGAVGLTGADGSDGCGTNQNEGGSGICTGLPQTASYPATAASILRSKGSNHFGNSKDKGQGARQIVSFSKPLDVLLGGGVALSELTEICGLPGAGKTQLAMQLSVDSRLPYQYGGVDGCAVVIDAEGSWSCAAGSDRLWALAKALFEHVKSSAARKMKAAGGNASINSDQGNSLVPPGFSPESILEGIHIFRVHDEVSQTCTLYNLPTFLLEMEQKGAPVKLVVIDSLAFHYRVASSSSYNSGAGGNKNSSLSTTHNLTRMAAFLTDMASEFDLAVVAMNHLTTRIEKDASNSQGAGTKLVPALGESWAHSVTSRLMIDHYRHPDTDALSANATRMKEVRTCTLVKSPHKPPGSALLMITDKGIRGVPDSFLQPTSKRARLE